MKTIFVINPTAGNEKCKSRWNSFEHELKMSTPFPYEAYFSHRAGEARTLAQEAVQLGFERIIAVGGDGTIHEIVNGVVGSDVLLGILPFGTGNDLARALKIPRSNNQLLDMLRHPREVVLNIGKVNDRYFVIATGIGFDGIVAEDINHHFYIKKMGAFGYFFSAIKVLLSFMPRDVTVAIDGKQVDLPNMWMLSIGNCPFYGGGMKLFPAAKYDDDLLDICLISNLNKSNFLRLFPLVYSGKHVKKEQYITTLQGKNIQVDCPSSMVAHADGECIPFSTLHITLSEHRVRFLKA